MAFVKKAKPAALHQMSGDTSVLVLSVVLEGESKEKPLAIRTQLDGVKTTLSWLMVDAQMQNKAWELSDIIQEHGSPAETMEFIEALYQRCLCDMTILYEENNDWLEYELASEFAPLYYRFTPKAQAIANEMDRDCENNEQESEYEDAPESAPENTTVENSTFALDLLYTFGILGGAKLCIAGIMATGLALTIAGGIIAAASGIGLAYTHGLFGSGSISETTDGNTSYTPQYT